MSDVFISYSRKDKDFVKVLHQALTASQYNAWVDWEDIPLTADWWVEIRSGIEQSDTFVFVISPDSINSKVCGQELDHAVLHNKRLMPIVRRDGFDSSLIRPTLGKHNWLFFREEDDFDSAFRSLVTALDTDLDHVKRHTRLLVKAIEWEHQHHNPDLLIRGSELEHTIQWLTQGRDKEPRSTELQLEYVNESRKAELAQRDAEIKRQKKARKAIATALVGVLVCLMIAIGLGLFSFGQYQTAETQRREATTNEISALSSSSKALLLSNQELNALLDALKAASRLKSAPWATANVQDQVRLALQQAVYDVRERNRLEGHYALVFSVSFNPNGQTIATGSGDNTIKLWDVNGKELRTLNGHEDYVISVSFSPDGKMLASASRDGTIKLWNADGQGLRTLVSSNAVVSVSFSPDGTIVAAATSGGGNNTVKLWRSDTGEELRTLRGHSGIVESVTFSPDGKMIASASRDNTIKLWSITGEELKTLQGHTDTVNKVSFSPSSQTIVSASNDNTIKLWNRDGQEIRTMRGHSNYVSAVSFSPDGQTIVSSSFDGTAKLWSSIDGQELRTFRGHTNGLTDVSFSSDGKTIATASLDNSVRLWNLNNQELKTLKGHSRSVKDVSFSPDGKLLASASEDSTIKLWSTDSGLPPNQFGQVLKTLNGHTYWVNAVSFSPDGKLLASGGNFPDTTVRLWSIDGQELKILKGHRAGVNSISFSPDGKTIASASWDGTAKLWNLNGQVLKTLVGHDDFVLSVSFSPDGKTIATGSNDSTIKLWNLQGKDLKTFTGHGGAISSIAFSPDSKTIASASYDKTIKLWNLQGQELKTFAGHEASVIGVSFSPDGRTIASSSSDKTIKLWNLDGQELKTLKGHADQVSNIRFSPDGKTIASASSDKTIKLWNAETLNSDQLVVRGCNWVEGYLITHPDVLQSIEICQASDLFAQSAPILVAQAEALARKGDTQGAIAKLQMALTWNPQLQIDPERTAQQFAAKGQAEHLLTEALGLGRQGKIIEAITSYTQAQQLDPDLQIPASSWDSLCWHGSLRDFVQDVAFACDRAVNLAPGNWSPLESRAANRALRGDFKGAIADLEKAIANGVPDEESGTRWQRWIATLQAGKNPITPDEIKSLLNE
ncbi:TIR domain-containing protein [Oscillatoria sp. FACHB-1407]|uniref:WD40 domain-containing protein n=1 Tax=Oscillatoria sp. FACHB-1407 TaxID=2692847 RepID=UPI0016847403|nr:TIR domain-containing protein [Oscillatoria sp. FACHB-1407]MBD2464547.1 TIR domain-containing protein [Oscillatoria sp. FACHB-1407]